MKPKITSTLESDIAELIRRGTIEHGLVFREMTDGGLLIEDPDGGGDGGACTVFKPEERGQPLLDYLNGYINTAPPPSEDIMDNLARER